MQAGNAICDRSIRNGWYKVIHEDDSEHRQMLEGIVSPNYCGTSNPIWLNGKFNFLFVWYILIYLIFNEQVVQTNDETIHCSQLYLFIETSLRKKSCTQTKLFFLSITRRNSSSSCRWYCEQNSMCRWNPWLLQQRVWHTD